MQPSTEKKEQEQKAHRKPRHKDWQSVPAADESHVILDGQQFSVYQPTEKKEAAKEKAPEPVAEDHAEHPIEEKVVEEMPKEQKKSMLRVVSTRSTLQGNLCKYIVDTESDSIEIDGGGVLTGILDKKTLEEIIEELTEIKSMFV